MGTGFPHYIISISFTEATKVFFMWLFVSRVRFGGWHIFASSSNIFLSVVSVSQSISLYSIFSTLLFALFANGQLNDRSESINCHFVILFLSLNKDILMISWKGIKEKEVLFIFPHCKFVISLKVIIKLEEDLKTCLENFWGHIICFLDPYISKSKTHLQWQVNVCQKGHHFIFFHDQSKVIICPGVICCIFLVIIHFTSLFPVYWQEDTSTKDKLFVKMDHLSAQTHIVKSLDK